MEEDEAGDGDGDEEEDDEAASLPDPEYISESSHI